MLKAIQENQAYLSTKYNFITFYLYLLESQQCRSGNRTLHFDLPCSSQRVNRNLSPTSSMNFNIIKQDLLSGGLIFTWCSGCSSTVIITRNLPFRGLILTGCSICTHAWINSVYLGWLTLNVATGVIAGLSSVVKGKGSSKRVTIFCGTFQVSPISDIKLITGFYNIRSSIQKLHNLSFLPRFLVLRKGLRANYIILLKVR